MNDVIWLVSSGEYSDYRVHAACRTEAEADALVARINLIEDRAAGEYGAYFAEERSVVTPDVQRVQVLTLRAVIGDNGTERQEKPKTDDAWPWEPTYYTHGRAGDPVSWRWWRSGEGGSLFVSGCDHERVRKVFSDMRAAFITDDALRAQEEAHS